MADKIVSRLEATLFPGLRDATTFREVMLQPHLSSRGVYSNKKIGSLSQLLQRVTFTLGETQLNSMSKLHSSTGEDEIDSPIW